jgi:flagellar P-ring protein precursor FlgI
MAFELLMTELCKLVQRKSTVCLERLVLLAAMWLFAAVPLFASEADHQMFLRDITQIEGVRDNQLVGYGLVVGLNRTGDTQQTYFTVQTLANSLSRLGVQISPSTVVVKNVAAVFVTATLPPFSRPGTKLDISVSSVGDAKSLAGGVLLMTPMRAPNGQVYAMAQGSLLLGGYAEGANGSSKTVNHATVGRIADGAVVERDAAVDLSHFKTVSLLLQNPDFTAARDVADVINKDFGKTVATTLDSRRIDIDVVASGITSVPILISRVQNLSIPFHSPAKVIVNERTGTVVMGGDVRLSPVSVIHGSLTIDVTTTHSVVQPAPFTNGKPEVVTETTLAVKDQPAQSIQLEEGANVDKLIRGLHAIGATSRDVISILQAIKAAGGLQADLEVI